MPEQQKVLACGKRQSRAAQDFAMSDFSPILVLQIKICIKPDRHSKGSNKIWESLSFWRHFFNNAAIWLQALICNRLNPRYEMQAVWLSIQRNHPFAYERLSLCQPNGSGHQGSMCWISIHATMLMPMCSRMTLDNTTTYGRDFAYCLKSHGGVRGIYMSLWWHSMHCAPFY